MYAQNAGYLRCRNFNGREFFIFCFGISFLFIFVYFLSVLKRFQKDTSSLF